MSAHALLALHNLAVVVAFFAGKGGVLAEASVDDNDTSDVMRDGTRTWEAEVRWFEEAYDARLEALEAARERWKETDLARGKGRLVREKEKQVPAAVVLAEVSEKVV